MKPKLIKTEVEHGAALARIEKLLDAEPGTPAGDELELWSALVEMYERERFPIDLPDPVSAIRFRMEQAGLSPSDLIPYLGSKSRVSEVLNGKRGLSLAMIRALSTGLCIPADVLIETGERCSAHAPAGRRARYRLNGHSATAADRKVKYGRTKEHR